MKWKYERAAYRPWEAIPPDPPSPDPGLSADFWLGRRDFSRALAGYEQAIRLAPDDADALNKLAWLLATCPEPGCRDGKRAVVLATRACGLTNLNHLAALDTLAAAYAEAGDFERAVRWQQVALHDSREDSFARKSFLTRLELYKAGKPYRAGPNGR